MPWGRCQRPGVLESRSPLVARRRPLCAALGTVGGARKDRVSVSRALGVTTIVRSREAGIECLGNRSCWI
jgi:hypothetical protein